MGTLALANGSCRRLLAAGDASSAVGRQQGYLDALHDAGIAPDPNLVVGCPRPRTTSGLSDENPQQRVPVPVLTLLLQPPKHPGHQRRRLGGQPTLDHRDPQLLDIEPPRGRDKLMQLPRLRTHHRHPGLHTRLLHPPIHPRMIRLRNHPTRSGLHDQRRPHRLRHPSPHITQHRRDAGLERRNRAHERHALEHVCTRRPRGLETPCATTDFACPWRRWDALRQNGIRHQFTV